MFCLIAMAKTSKMMLKRSGESEHAHLGLDLWAQRRGLGPRPIRRAGADWPAQVSPRGLMNLDLQVLQTYKGKLPPLRSSIWRVIQEQENWWEADRKEQSFLPPQPFISLWCPLLANRVYRVISQQNRGVVCRVPNPTTQGNYRQVDLRPRDNTLKTGTQKVHLWVVWFKHAFSSIPEWVPRVIRTLPLFCFVFLIPRFVWERLSCLMRLMWFHSAPKSAS